ncbi:hypothetical protein M6B38_345540 [Iris pallida]|uniref:Uncharacterized protein n=1 Tax=Iris pallida TaxID=29817 RepID=A0AAX6GUU7_IRIPA|nr:hypothetical protein M6B38_345540 [Iris pallida]
MFPSGIKQLRPILFEGFTTTRGDGDGGSPLRSNDSAIFSEEAPWRWRGFTSQATTMATGSITSGNQPWRWGPSHGERRRQLGSISAEYDSSPMTTVRGSLQQPSPTASMSNRVLYNEQTYFIFDDSLP